MQGFQPGFRGLPIGNGLSQRVLPLGMGTHVTSAPIFPPRIVETPLQPFAWEAFGIGETQFVKFVGLSRFLNLQPQRDRVKVGDDLVQVKPNQGEDQKMKTTKGKRFLILDAETDLPKDFYDPTAHWSQHLNRLGIPHDSIKVDCPFSLRVMERATHMIITGSSASVVSDEPLPDWYENATQFVQFAIDHCIPVLGVCFGHQFLARMLAGAGAVQKARVPGVGWQITTVTHTDPLLGAEAQRFSAFHLHFDEVVELPADAVVLAHTSLTEIAAFALTDHPVWGIQAHPEITPNEGKSLLEKMRRRVPRGKKEYLERALGSEPNDSGHIDKIIQSFGDQGSKEK